MTEQELNYLGFKVADNVSGMLAYWDMELVCRFANKAYLQWFGKPPEEIVGKLRIHELLGKLYDQNLEYISSVLKGLPQTFEREMPLPDGSVRCTMASYIPDIVEGKQVGFFVQVVDITHLKLLERNLQRSNEVIKEQNERLLNFANITSHNLKTYAYNLEEILTLLIQADTDAERAEMMNYLQQISKGFSATVVNLTELADVQNLVSISSEDVNLYDFAERAIGILKIELNAINGSIVNNIPPGLTIIANAAFIESIFLNLLTNAVKYRHRVRSLLVNVWTVIEQDELTLNVMDNGLGIDLQKYRHELFGMYKTFHGNGDAKGIGLFITKFQVEAMGGRIEVESNPDNGTTFRIKLPVAFFEI